MMLTDDEYFARATEEHCRRMVAREEGEIANLAAQMRHADERAETHLRLCKRHNLKPEATSAKSLAQAEREYAAAWTSFVVSSASSGARALHILDPHNSGIEDKETITALLAHQAKLRKQFEASWPPSDLIEKIGEGVTDGIAQHYGHAA